MPRCVLYTDVSVGKEVPFDILTAAAGPGQSAVNITGPSGRPVPCSVTPVPEGSTAKFTPQEPGPHSVQVTFGDQPVPNSPFTTVATQVCFHSVTSSSSIPLQHSLNVHWATILGPKNCTVTCRRVTSFVVSRDHVEHF